jgi:N4-gp56 family major capsid protein
MGDERTTTLKSDMIVPEVFGDIVTAKFKGKLVIANFALTDTTLVGNPGDTVHFPKWNPIGDAEDLEEDVAMVPEVLTSSDADATVKEVGKAVVISDQALLSSIGDPLDEAGAQVGKVVARKIDADLVSEAVTNCPEGRVVDTNDEFYEKVADAKSLWGDEAEEIAVLLVHSKMYTALLKDANFISADKYPAGVLITGAIGTLYGVPVMITDRVPYATETGIATSIMLERNALGYITKRAPIVETGRDILKRNTIITTNVHYAVKLINTDGIAVIKHSLAGGGYTPGVDPVEVTRADGDVTQDAGKTGGTGLTYAFVAESKKLTINANNTELPYYEADGSTPPRGANWVGVAIPVPEGVNTENVTATINGVACTDLFFADGKYMEYIDVKDADLTGGAATYTWVIKWGAGYADETITINLKNVAGLEDDLGE